MGSSRTLLPAGALVAAVVLAACGRPAADPARPAAAPTPAAATTTSRDANRPLPHALPAPPASTARPAPAPSAPPTTAPSTTAPARHTAPAAPPPPRTAPPRAPVRTAAPAAKQTGPVYPPGTTVLHIGKWSRPVVRGDQATIDRCISAVLFAGPDPAQADGTAMRTTVIVGHDFCGYAILAPLPVGTRVTLDTPQGTLSYHVYATYITPGQGGPDSGLYWGDLTLQTCVGPDTGFSYLQRD
ncbi:hypothetical protein [Streptomyces sp. NPDC021224]|uniref:hypothetical protein n=1 Tax=unclassified Streptomyces TaxID=2593676 RepID=UPI003799B94B